MRWMSSSPILTPATALAGRDLEIKAYNESVNEKYRFDSYGDWWQVD